MSNKVSVWSSIKSVLASFIGIQSERNYEIDATSDKHIKLFIITGVVIAILMHVMIYVIVKIILWQSGVE